MHVTHTVDNMAAYKCQVREADSLGLTLILERHALNLVSIASPVLQLANKEEVDFMDELQMARQDLLEQPHGPLFARSCHQ